MDNIYSFKIILSGKSGVGKTYLCNSLNNINRLIETGITIGVDYCSHQAKINNVQYKLNIWDIGGHPNFYNISDSYVQESVVGCILMIDLNDITSIVSVIEWWYRVKRKFRYNYPEILIIGNKEDLITDIENVKCTKIFMQLIKETRGHFVFGSLKTDPDHIKKSVYNFVEKIKNRKDLQTSEGYKIKELKMMYSSLNHNYEDYKIKLDKTDLDCKCCFC